MEYANERRVSLHEFREVLEFNEEDAETVTKLIGEKKTLGMHSAARRSLQDRTNRLHLEQETLTGEGWPASSSPRRIKSVDGARVGAPI